MAVGTKLLRYRSRHLTAPAGAITAAAGGVAEAGAGIVGICKAASYDAKAIYLNAFVTGGVCCWGQ
ncbi:hypothetical protein C5D16_09685 [Rathayibacter toxicus]|uniref:Uncharacterized protein n=1 Tax=Rathayibacter toxicus TaxID=145458 RepID=A0A2S5Y5D4_9MICO|nr:hypothetical protein C5D15_09720 [Rathayibacter toxicus]PPG45854.1 hypothetical protein C5D16_09685 [Rathayibacter toxicus]PPH71826.1 hypothetical protein C5D24_09645 [Rathayibacter toxicus]PPI13953.1 hypothetical protein C5C51_09660 [Rathayibacter toxicus]PPI22412.1 hypothetical protein C5D55_09735 [Rathayibacter toxicus]